MTFAILVAIITLGSPINLFYVDGFTSHQCQKEIVVANHISIAQDQRVYAMCIPSRDLKTMIKESNEAPTKTNRPTR